MTNQTDQTNLNKQEFDQAFDKDWPKPSRAFSDDAVLNRMHARNGAWWAWQLQAERLKPLLACSTCDGTPHASGLVCVCGGKNTSLAERDGLRRECHDLEQQLDEARTVIDKSFHALGAPIAAPQAQEVFRLCREWLSRARELGLLAGNKERRDEREASRSSRASVLERSSRFAGARV